MSKISPKVERLLLLTEIKGRGPLARDRGPNRGWWPAPERPGQGWSQLCLKPTLGGQKAQNPTVHTPTGGVGAWKQPLPKEPGWIPRGPCTHLAQQHSRATDAGD